ncbi:MAG: sigma-70 family RNA polymerase sigma factor [Syntrophorhabdales bacterium]
MERDEKPDRNGEAALLAMFMADVRKFPILSRAEEAELMGQAAAGSKAARDRLVESNLRFVVKVAVSSYRDNCRRYPGLSLMDLVSEGAIGLMRAVKGIDPALGFRVLTYAKPAILHRAWRVIIDYRRHEMESLDDAIFEGEEDGGQGRLDLLAGEDEGADVAALYEQLRALIARLKSNERTVIENRYLQDKTLDEIGVLLNVTGERVRRIERRALLRLRWAIDLNEQLYGVESGAA